MKLYSTDYEYNLFNETVASVASYYMKASFHLVRIAITGKRLSNETLAETVKNVIRRECRLHWMRDAV